MFVFDSYGTLLDVDAVAREVAAEPGMEALRYNWLHKAAKRDHSLSNFCLFPSQAMTASAW